MLIASSQLPFAWKLNARGNHAAERVAGLSDKVQAIACATALAVLNRKDTKQDVQAAAKATVEREATRVWAQKQRARFGQTDIYEPAALAFGFAEQQTDHEHRIPYPMWQKVLFLEQAGIRHEDAAEIIGTDTLTIALELPLARAYCAP